MVGGVGDLEVVQDPADQPVADGHRVHRRLHRLALVQRRGQFGGRRQHDRVRVFPTYPVYFGQRRFQDREYVLRAGKEVVDCPVLNFHR